MDIFRLDNTYYMADSIGVAIQFYLYDSDDPTKRMSDVDSYLLSPEECESEKFYCEVSCEYIPIVNEVGRRYLDGTLEEGYFGKI